MTAVDTVPDKTELAVSTVTSDNYNGVDADGYVWIAQLAAGCRIGRDYHYCRNI